MNVRHMSENIKTLLTIMTRLRDPKTGCPWDIEQNFKTILPYTIEEAYEVAQAIQESDMEALLDELGDLLLQVVFHAEMAREAGYFDFNDVAKGISEKMVRRHPHVFADSKISDADQQSLAWESQKAIERSAKAKKKNKPSSALDGVALALPSLVRAQKLQKRARRLGFDWQTTGPIIEKIAEELAEMEEARSDNRKSEDLNLECGDLLFSCVNLVRHLGVDAESALREANAKFEHRFRRLETLIADEDRQPDQMSLRELDVIWKRVKSEES